MLAHIGVTGNRINPLRQNNMLRETISETKFHFIDFDSEDAELLKVVCPTWVRIDGGRLGDFPPFHPAELCHILIQKDTALHNVATLSKVTSIEFYACPKVDLSSLSGPTIRQLKLRRMPIHNIEAVENLKSIESLWLIRMKIDDFSFLDDLSNLKCIWLSPIGKSRLERLSISRRGLMFSNGDVAYQNGQEIHPHVFEEKYEELDVCKIAIHP